MNLVKIWMYFWVSILLVKRIRAHFLKFLSDFIFFYKMAGSFKMASKKWKQTKLSPGFPDINLQFIQRSRDCVSMLHGCCLQYNPIKDPRNWNLGTCSRRTPSWFVWPISTIWVTDSQMIMNMFQFSLSQSFFFLNCSNIMRINKNN